MGRAQSLCRCAADPLAAAAPPPAQAEEVEVEAADRDLVAVVELVELDPLTTYEHAVQAAIVEHARPAVVAIDERVAARDRGIVEAHVRRQAATDARPAVLKGDDLDAVVRLEGEVVALRDQGIAGVLEPVGRTVDGLGGLGGVVTAEQRCAAEPPAAAGGTRRNLVTLVKGDREAARVTAEGAGACQRSRAEGFHGYLSSEPGVVRMVATRAKRVCEKPANCGLFHKCGPLGVPELANLESSLPDVSFHSFATCRVEPAPGEAGSRARPRIHAPSQEPLLDGRPRLDLRRLPAHSAAGRAAPRARLGTSRLRPLSVRDPRGEAP